MTDVLDETERAEEARNLPAVRAAEAIVARGEVTVPEVVAQRDKIQQVMQEVMRPEVHYGTIPGVQKPTLLKPGAEVLCVTFRFAPHYASERTFHDGGHMTVVTKVSLQHIPTGLVVAEGEGLCTTYEKKYAYRGDGRICPNCGVGAIKKSKFKPRPSDYDGASPADPPGWYCHSAAGGCGTNFPANDPAIVGQEAGRIANPDLPDTWNTVLKMANKRALIAAILNGTAASDIFTQDVEDGAASTGAGRQQQAQTREPSYRDEDPGFDWPRGWPALTERMSRMVGDDEAAVWMRQAILALHGKDVSELDADERGAAFSVCSRALRRIETLGRDIAFDQEARKTTQAIWADLLEGAVLDGPEWSLTPAEAADGFPAKTDVIEDAETAPADDESESAEDIPFGNNDEEVQQ